MKRVGPTNIKHRKRAVKALSKRERDLGPIIDTNPDIAERKPAEALLVGEKRLLEMVASGCPLKEVLDATCGIVDTLLSDSACSILLIDTNGNFRHGAGPTLPPGYESTINGVPVVCEAGPCGTAASLKEQVIVPDLVSDSRWVGLGWRTLALEHGLRSVCSTPIVSLTGKVLGTFAIYQRDPGTPSALLKDIVARFTHIASIAIERVIKEGELRERERESRTVLDSIPGLVSSFSPSGETEIMSQRMLDYFGKSLEQTRHWEENDIIHPEDLPRVIRLLSRALASEEPLEYEARLRRFDAVYRWFQVRAFPSRESTGRVARWYTLITDIDDLKRAQEELAASERDLRSIINTIPTTAWSARPDGYCDFLNQRWLDYAGLTSDQALGWGWAAAIHPDDRKGVVECWQSCLASGTPVDTEARMRRYDGAYRWFLFRANPVRDELGKIVKWYGTNIDIDDRKRGEQAQLASELSWRQIVDNIPGLVATMGPLGEVEFLNRQTLEYFGKTNEELKNWSLIGAVHPDDLPRVFEARKKSLDAGQIYEVEHRCCRADGIYRWFQVRGLPVRNAKLEITAWYLLLTDIDDRKKAEEALQSSERNLSLMINAIPTLIEVSGPDGAVLSVNQAVLDYYGVSLEDMQKKDFRSRFYHPDDVERLREERNEALKRPLQFEYEQRALGKDGRYRWFLVRYNPLLDEQGRIDTWYVAAFDIEVRKQMESLRAAERRTLEMIGDGASLRDVLDQLCNSVDAQVAPSVTTVLLTDADGKRLWEGGGPRVPREWISSIIPVPVAFEAGLCGTAAFLKTRVIVPDVATEPNWPGQYRDLALRNGIRAAWSEPILTKDSEVLGTFALYSHESRVPNDEDLALIKGAGQIARIAIERQRSQEALRKALEEVKNSEAKMRQVIDAIPTLAWCNLPDGSNDFLSRSWHEYTGLSPEQSHGWGWQIAFHPEDLPSLMEKWRGMLVSGQPGEIESRLRRYDGTYRWFLIRAEPFRDETGEIVRWYGTSTDINDRRGAEAQVEQAYLRLAEAQRLSKTGSFITDLVADDHNWSEEAFRIFEFDPAVKVSVHTIRNTVHPEDLPTFDAVIARGMSGTDVDFVFRIVTSRGAVKHLRGMARVMTQSGDRPLFIGALQDVTESKVAEEALDKARTELSHVARITTLNALTASIAHEVNQPLSGVITNANTCRRMLDGNPPNLDGARETARRIIRDGTRASDVITRLRALFSKKEFTLEPLDLNEATREVIALSLSDLQRNEVILRLELADDLPPVVGDRVQLQQVILNLLRNASDAMVGIEDRPRELLIKTERDEGDRARVRVRDAGVGFTSEARDKLFEAFYTTKNDGMGIGLSVSRSIIERHHGRLWAEPNDGPGVTFLFSIPCSLEKAASAAPQ